jgi:hypothetical protein
MENRIDQACHLIYNYGGIDGDHHKQWILDQVLKILLGPEDYDLWLENYEGGGQYEWDKGIAP